MQVIRAGRVSERLGSGAWRDVFMVLTDHDLAFYVRPPTTTAELLQGAVACYPLLGLRYVPGNRRPGPREQPLDEREADEGCFTIRLASGLQHYFSAGLPSNQRDWAYAVQSRAGNAVRILQVISLPLSCRPPRGWNRFACTHAAHCCTLAEGASGM